MSDDTLMISGSPPPRKDDVLFGSSEDWQTKACIAHLHDAEGTYRGGFRPMGFRRADNR
jgi:hypothetical protein